MHTMDWVVLASYFIILLAIGLWASSKSKKKAASSSLAILSAGII